MIRSSACRRSRPRPNRAARTLAFVLVLLVAVTELACSQKTLPAPGEVVVLLSTDMQVPESFDTVILTVGDIRRAYLAPNAPTPKDQDSDCRTDDAVSNKLAFPTTVALLSEANTPTTVSLTLTACKSGKVVFRQPKFDVEIPEPGQIKMLRAPIRWLCNDWTANCYGCSDSSQQACHHQNITVRNGPALCQTDACQPSPASSEFFAAIGYNAVEVAAYDPSPVSTAGCFKPWSCFDMQDDSQFDDHAWVQVATGWQQAEGDAGSGDAGVGPACVATLERALPSQSAAFNLALILPPGGQGFCDSNRCLVPLDAQESVGWTWLGSDARRVALPNAVCHLLDSGQVLYVVGSQKCASKGRTTPICGADPTLNRASPTLTPLVDDAIVYLGLDTVTNLSPQLLANPYGTPFDFGVHAANQVTEVTMASAAAVWGTGAGIFNSQQYAKSRDPVTANDYTLSAWVSLTEYADSSESVMPILSNLSSDCSSGARLELRVCSDQSTVVMALGTPTKPSTPDQCSLSYTFAPFAKKSYQGGYFTPWQAGSWYHVVATFDREQGPALYLDAARVDDPNVGANCGSPVADPQPSDKSFLYLGSQATFAGTPARTRDLLIDEVMVFDKTLSAEQVKRLSLESSTVAGPSGLRWGAWGTQGSFAQVDPSAPAPEFNVADLGYSSAGGYALLGESQSLSNVSLDRMPPRLSDFDEAVLVVTPLPAGKPFQVALVAEHGKRQCTWQMFGNPKSADAGSTTPGSDTYVINLRRPSWCVDPACSFDVNQVEKLSLGSDWEGNQGKFSYAVQAIALRKRPGSLKGSTDFGGITGPSDWCWKPVTYEPAWEVQPVTAVASNDGTKPVQVAQPEFYALSKPGAVDPELAADLPNDAGSRDLTSCAAIGVCADLKSPGDGSQPTPYLVMRNELGQTYAWKIVDPANCPSLVKLDSSGLKYAAGLIQPTLADILGSVTRISIRHPGSITVRSVKCCASATDPSTCQDIY
jgi:hypothetical protein